MFFTGKMSGFKNGGFDKGRRNFLKLAAGLASIPFVGKYFKFAKPAAKVVDLNDVKKFTEKNPSPFHNERDVTRILRRMSGASNLKKYYNGF